MRHQSGEKEVEEGTRNKNLTLIKNSTIVLVNLKKRTYVTAIHLAGGNFITVAHFFRGCHVDEVEAQHDTSKVLFKLNDVVHKFLDSSDLVVFKIPKMKASDAISKFATHRNVPNPFESLIFTNYVEGMKTQHATSTMYVGDTEYKLDNKDVCLHETISYKAKVHTGMCGSPIVAIDGPLKGRIVGIHVAGCSESDEGRAVTLMPGELQALLPKFASHGCSNDTFVGDHGTNLAEYLGGAEPSAYSVSQAPKSRLKQTEACGILAVPAKFPAILANNDPRLPAGCNVKTDPWKKYSAPSHALKECHKNVISDFILDMVNEIPCANKVVMKTNDAVFGRRVDDELARGHQPMNLSSSDGYPYKTKQLVRTTYASNGDPIYVPTKELYEETDRIREQILDGERPDIFAQGCLKDELRKEPKIMKPRLFTAFSKPAIVLFREYFGEFVAHLHATVGSHSCAVGLDPYSADWHFMVCKLLGNSDMGFAGDYTEWDGSLPPDFMEWLVDIINSWYGGTDEEELVRRALMYENTYTRIAAGNYVYMKTKGMPSGTYATSELNSLINHMAFLYCYLEISGESSLEKYKDNVVNFFYGDDNILSISNKISSFFNPQSICNEMAKIGLLLTNEDKTQVTPTLRRVIDLSFLKRTIRIVRKKKSMIYLSVLEFSTLEEMLNWSDCSDESYPAWKTAVVRSICKELGSYPILVVKTVLTKLEPLGCVTQTALSIKTEALEHLKRERNGSKKHRDEFSEIINSCTVQALY
jgi:hypothetical protein